MRYLIMKNVIFLKIKEKILLLLNRFTCTEKNTFGGNTI